MIPFFDLTLQYKRFGEEICQAVTSVLESGNYILGEPVEEFERDFGFFCNTRHAIAVNSGTSALHLALLAAGIGPGDEVITTPLTFFATTAAILYTGAMPVFVDIDPATYCIDSTLIRQAITDQTKAILPVHLYGHPAPMGPLIDIAKSHSLLVIEDAAQAHGAAYGTKRVGGIGDLGCFSFYPSKNLGAVGEGGMVTTQRDDLAEKVRLLRDWGAKEKNEHQFLGFNMRMPAIQGAALQVKLRYLDEWNAARRSLAGAYDEALGHHGLESARHSADVQSVFHLYVIQVNDRQRVMHELVHKEIMTAVHYPHPVHLQPAVAHLGYHRGDFPIAEKACEHVLSLPMYPELDPSAPAAVAQQLADVLATVENTP